MLFFSLIKDYIKAASCNYGSFYIFGHCSLTPACAFVQSGQELPCLLLALCMLGILSSAKMLFAEFLKLAFSSIFFKEY